MLGIKFVTFLYICINIPKMNFFINSLVYFGPSNNYYANFMI